MENKRPRILEDYDILIVGNRIKVINPADEPPKHVEVVDSRRMLAIPGLINTHAHVPMCLFRGVVEDVPIEQWFNDYIWHIESNPIPEDVYWDAMLDQAEMIENGIITVADY